MAKTLTVQTIGGLASRMRAVIPAKAHCDRNGLSLTVNWSSHTHVIREEGYRFKCPLSDLWTGFVENDDDRSGSKAALSGFIRTCHPESFAPESLPSLGEVFREFVAAAPLQQRLDALPNVGERSVGIHIRTQHAHPEATPVEWFCRLLELIPADVEIVLSCESDAVSRAIHSIRPIIEQEKSYRYDHDGIVAAAADLYLLSCCRWIVGSARSSFSQLASWLQSGGPDPQQWKAVKHGDWRTWLYGDRYLDDTKTHREADLLREFA